MTDGKQNLLITGGGRGIGAAVARHAAQRGWRLAINYARDSQSAEALVREIEAGGGEAFAVRGDVGSEDEVLTLFEAVDARFGQLHGLVNSAGIVAPRARLDEMDFSRLERMMRVNVVGTMLCAREAVKRMSTRHGGGGGAIVNLSSVAAALGSPSEYVDYATSKGAVDTFTIGLARELAEEGIRVNAVRPGIIATEIHASGGQPDRIERMKGFVPMKREGSPDEIAWPILWLLSREASYTTGAILDVGGGR